MNGINKHILSITDLIILDTRENTSYAQRTKGKTNIGDGNMIYILLSPHACNANN